MPPIIVGIPPATRLHQLVQVGDEWHVWIALKKRELRYEDWQGTYLRVEPNGRVTHVRRDDNYLDDDEFVIKEADR